MIRASARVTIRWNSTSTACGSGFVGCGTSTIMSITSLQPYLNVSHAEYFGPALWRIGIPVGAGPLRVPAPSGFPPRVGTPPVADRLRNCAVQSHRQYDIRSGSDAGNLATGENEVCVAM